jgi:hypothetical protein
MGLQGDVICIQACQHDVRLRHGRGRELAVRRGSGRCLLASAGKKKGEQGPLSDRRGRFAIEKKRGGRSGGLVGPAG